MNGTTMRRAVLLGLLAFTAVARAEEPSSDSKLGGDTHNWVDFQKNSPGDSARPVAPMTGEVADKVYQRYVNSFGHPLPVTFPRDSFGGSSGGSGGGSGSTGGSSSGGSGSQ